MSFFYVSPTAIFTSYQWAWNLSSQELKTREICPCYESLSGSSSGMTRVMTSIAASKASTTPHWVTRRSTRAYSIYPFLIGRYPNYISMLQYASSLHEQCLPRKKVLVIKMFRKSDVKTNDDTKNYKDHTNYKTLL